MQMTTHVDDESELDHKFIQTAGIYVDAVSLARVNQASKGLYHTVAWFAFMTGIWNQTGSIVVVKFGDREGFDRYWVLKPDPPDSIAHVGTRGLFLNPQ